MKKAFAVIIIILLCLVFAAFSSTQAQTNTMTQLVFTHRVGDKELRLFEETYTNSFGEPFTVNKFRYYVSDVSLAATDGKKVSWPGNYFLVNEADSTSKKIEFPFPGIVSSIEFTIGVDSTRNVGGVQTGALDPMNGMFWTWNSGYVFAKLEGQSDVSHAPAHGFTWDAGGFRQHENAIRKVKLAVPKTAGTHGTVTIVADILNWFDGVHPLKISISPTCHQPGVLAMQLADNYSKMFSVAP